MLTFGILIFFQKQVKLFIFFPETALKIFVLSFSYLVYTPLEYLPVVPNYSVCYFSMM